MWNIIKLFAAYSLFQSLTVLYSFGYNFDESTISNALAYSTTLAICLLGVYFTVVGLVYTIYPKFLKPKFKKVISIVMSKVQEFCKPRFDILKDELENRKNT